MINQLRLLIAEWMMGLALEVLPNGSQKIYYAKLIHKYMQGQAISCTRSRIPMISMWWSEFGEIELPENAVHLPDGDVLIDGYCGKDIDAALELAWNEGRIHKTFDELRPDLLITRQAGRARQ